MKITEQEQLERRERIITTAFALFCERGIEGVTMADIAKKADVGNTTIYRYFVNKPQLVLATLSALWEAIGKKIENNIEQTANYENMTGYAQLATWMKGWRRLYQENADYVLFSYESKLYLLRNSLTLTARQYDALMEDIKNPCMKAIEKGKNDGTIQSSYPTEDIFYAIWGAIRGYIVKIVLYNHLCRDGSPWERCYPVVESGVLKALHMRGEEKESEQTEA